MVICRIVQTLAHLVGFALHASFGWTQHCLLCYFESCYLKLCSNDFLKRLSNFTDDENSAFSKHPT